jgi:hypothetical protein
MIAGLEHYETREKRGIFFTRRHEITKKIFPAEAQRRGGEFLTGWFDGVHHK